MITTIYQCDKCKCEQPTSEQFWMVGVTATHVSWNQDGRDFVKGMSLHVCRTCLESFGIYVQKKLGEPEPPKPPTLEELIIQIVRDHTNG